MNIANRPHNSPATSSAWHARRSSTVVAIAWAVTWLAAIAGCGSDRPETVPVSGRVTLDGGAWPNKGMIIFSPIQAADGFPRRPGRAVFERDGQFSASSYADEDGLVPGTYRATLQCGEPVVDDTTPVRSHVPPRYQTSTQSDWEIVVAPGASAMTVEFDIRSDEP